MISSNSKILPGEPGRLFIVEQNALSTGGHYYSYTRCIAEAAIELGLITTVLLNHRFVGSWDLTGLRTQRAFTFTWGEAESIGRRTWGVGNLAFEFARATAVDPPVSGDHVLFHTLGYAELLALLDYLTSLPGRLNLPTYHLLLRYDPSYMLDDIASFRPMFERVANSHQLRRAVRFHADTEALAQAFSRLILLPVSCLPIPFDQRHLRARPNERRPADKLVVAYLGDARLEKGYGQLPEAIAALRRHVLPRPVAFIIQSNFNTPEGETGMLAAREALSAMAEVEILYEPLHGQDYYARLAEADAILLPYDPKRYVARSSGILIEALAYGKPILTSAKSWMATQVAPDHAVLFDGQAGLSAALYELATRFDELASRAVAIAPRWQDAATGCTFVAALLDSADRERDELTGKRVLVVMNGDAMVLRNGASRIALAQFAYLNKARYRVAGIFLGYDPEAIAGSLENWRTSLTDRIRGCDFEAIHAIVLDRASQRLWRDDAAGPTIAADLAMHRRFLADAALKAYLNDHPVDVVLLNYVTALPLLDQLGLSHVPIICEMHDIQSLQKAIYGKRPPSDADFQVEYAALARCRHLISLNSDEALVAAGALGGLPITVTGIFPPRPMAGVGALAGCVDLADVFASCGPAVMTAETLASLRELKRIDLLFVGSNHRPNVSGLRWFLEEVFLPRLAPLGHTIAVAGSVTDYEAWPQAPGIVYLGRVAILDPLYAAASIVLLPILEGAGSPVKTVEALQHGKALVATSQAFRGIDAGLLASIAIADDEATFADRVLTMLEDADTHGRCVEAVRALGATLADSRRYLERMNEVFSDVLEEAPQVGCGGEMIRDPLHPAVTWGSALAAANQIVRDAVTGRSTAAAARAAARTMPDDRLLSLLETITEALVVRQSAPILRFDKALLQAVAAANVNEINAAIRAFIEANNSERAA